MQSCTHATLLMQKWNCLSNKCSSVGYTKGYTDVTGENNLAKAVANKGPIRYTCGCCILTSSG